MTTLELDTLAETHIRDHGGIPNFQLVPGYRHTLCTSVNEEIVHGIPGSRVLREGDLLSIDCGAQVGLWNGDAAVSVVVGGAEAGRARGPRAHRGHRGLAVGRHRRAARGREPVRRGRGRRGQPHRERCAAAAGSTASSRTTSATASARRCTWTRRCPTTGSRGKGPKVVDGTTICIEPMVALGDQDNIVLDDEWTVVTRDRSRAAHWEHSVAATAQGLCVLTAVDGGAARLARARGGVRPDRPRLTRLSRRGAPLAGVRHLSPARRTPSRPPLGWGHGLVTGPSRRSGHRRPPERRVRGTGGRAGTAAGRRRKGAR